MNAPGAPADAIAAEIRAAAAWLHLQIDSSTQVCGDYLKALLIEQACIAGSASVAATAPATTGQSLTLTPDQRAAVDGILFDIRVRGARPVLCGYAGTGKTVTTAALVSELIEAERRVVVATPTHKARAQVERALAANGAHGFEAVTVHRLLGLKQVRDWATGKETFAPDPGGKNMLC